MSSGVDAVSSKDYAGSVDDLGFSPEDERITKVVMKLWGAPLRYPREFKTWLPDYVALQIPDIPVTQIFGFLQFVPQISSRLTDDTVVTSRTFADPISGAAGPTITGLPPGQYLILLGAVMAASSAATPFYVGVKVNTTEAVDSDSIVTYTPTAVPGMTALAKTLSLDTNTITMRFRTASGTALALYRWMIALKYANA